MKISICHANEHNTDTSASFTSCTFFSQMFICEEELRHTEVCKTEQQRCKS